MNDQAPPRFFIIALPRSRTAWLATLLTYADVACLHEPLIGCRNMADLADRLARCDARAVGAADTALPLFLPELLEHFPDARLVALRSDVGRFRAWADHIGVEASRTAAMIEAHAAALSALAPKALTLSMHDLDDTDAVAALWAYCGSTVPFNRQRFEMLRDMRVEAMLDRVVAKIHANREAVADLFAFGGCEPLQVARP